jgi:hypothetical protein
MTIDSQEFRKLLHAMGASTGIPYHYNQLIAYIDGRTAGAVPESVKEKK